jgi:hypothetical protein
MQSRLDCWSAQQGKGGPMLFALFYVLAISILIMHFTGIPGAA